MEWSYYRSVLSLLHQTSCLLDRVVLQETKRLFIYKYIKGCKEL